MKKGIYYIVGIAVSLVVILFILVNIPSPYTASLSQYEFKNNHIYPSNDILAISGYKVNLTDNKEVVFGRLNPTSYIKIEKIEEPELSDSNSGIDNDIDTSLPGDNNYPSSNYPNNNNSDNSMISYNHQYNEVIGGVTKGYNKTTRELEDVFVADAYNKHIGKLRNPLNKEYMTISSVFGVRKDPFGKDPGNGSLPFHTGLDFSAANINGANIYSVSTGRVTLVEKSNSGYGNMVVVNYGDFDVIYAHMSSIGSNIKENTIVKAGEVLGQVGSTGRSTGPHLHIEILFGDVAVSPETLLSLVGDTSGIDATVPDPKPIPKPTPEPEPEPEPKPEPKPEPEEDLVPLPDIKFPFAKSSIKAISESMLYSFLTGK